MDDHIFHKSILALREYLMANKEKVTDDLNEMIKKSKIKTMKIEKKKPGGLRKVKKPVITVPNQAEIDLEHAERALVAKDEIIADLEGRLDAAFKEQEEMLRELNKCINATMRHCDQVVYNTGSIVLHDVEYCGDMIKRIMENKFGYKPQTQEL